MKDGITRLRLWNAKKLSDHHHQNGEKRNWIFNLLSKWFLSRKRDSWSTNDDFFFILKIRAKFTLVTSWPDLIEHFRWPKTTVADDPLSILFAFNKISNLPILCESLYECQNPKFPSWHHQRVYFNVKVLRPIVKCQNYPHATNIKIIP